MFYRKRTAGLKPSPRRRRDRSIGGGSNWLLTPSARQRLAAGPARTARPARLVGVHAAVGFEDELVGGTGGEGIEDAVADAGGEDGIGGCAVDGGADAVDDAVDDGAVDAFADDDELVAADAGDKIAAADAFDDALGGQTDGEIAHQMAAAVVDGLEIVNVDHQKEQERVFRMIPGLEHAEFQRYGMIHRNTYIHSPKILAPTLETRDRAGLFFAGQLTGVEGYVESTSNGLLAGINAVRAAEGRERVVFPVETAIGALANYVSTGGTGKFDPLNITFGLIPPLGERIRNKKEKNAKIAQRSLDLIATMNVD